MQTEPVISLILIVLTYSITTYFISKTKNEIKPGKKTINILLSAFTGLTAGFIIHVFAGILVVTLVTASIIAILTYFSENKFYNIMTPATLAACLLLSNVEIKGLSFILSLLFALSNYTKNDVKKKMMEKATIIILLIVTIIVSSSLI